MWVQFTTATTNAAAAAAATTNTPQGNWASPCTSLLSSCRTMLVSTIACFGYQLPPLSKSQEQRISFFITASDV